MSFQPLSPETAGNIDPFNVSSLTGVDAHTGIYLDADPENSSVLIETNSTPALYIDKFQNMGINTLSPSAQLDVNSSSGSCIQLTYNNSTVNKANIGVTSDGKLILMAGGSEVSVDTTSNFNVKSHNGSSSGLMLGNSLVLASADQLNFNVVTPGTASNSKSLVLNSSGSIAGINTFSASKLVGTLQTASQPNLTSVSVLDIADHNGVTGLQLGGSLVTSTATQLNYVDTTPGMAAASKALVVNANRDILNINSLTAAQLVGTLQTPAQPNVTSVGTLNGLDIDGQLTGLIDLSINTTETGRALVVNDESGNCVRLFYDAASNASNYADLLVDGSGNLSLTTSGGNVDITSHDGASQGLKLGSVLVTATADQMNYLQGTTPGSVTPGKAMIIDSNRNIANINAVTAATITGTLQTAAQPNIASVNALNITTHNGSTLGLKLNGALVTATAAELNYVDTTAGTAEASKALVTDGNTDIAGIHAVTAQSFYGTIQTPAQPNITSVGLLESISTSGALTMGMTTIDEGELQVLDNVEPGVASAGKALVVNENIDVSGIHALTASELTGTLQTASQPNVTSVSTLNITAHDGETQGLALDGTLVTSTATELNYVNTTPGFAQASKALIVDSNSDIKDIHALTASQLTGTLQTVTQPNVTSVGTLTSISTSGDLTMGSTTISETEIKVLDAVTPGTVKASSAVVVDENKDISSFRNLTAVNLTGTLQTAAQPNVTSVTTLDITGANGTDAGLKLGGVLLTATADQINSIFGAGGTGTFTNLSVNNTLTLSNADGSSKGLTLGSTLVTASGAELNYLDGSTPGSATANNAVVLDANSDISGIHSLTASQLTGTLQTAAQPNVTSVGTLTSVATSGNLTMGATIISESEIAVIDQVTPGTVAASKAVVVDANKDIGSFRNLTADNLIGTTVTGTIQTAAQPNITSVGTLTSVNTSGNLTMGATTISESEIKVLDAVTPGTAAASKAMVLDANKAITGIATLSTKQLTLEAANIVYGDTWTPSASTQKYSLSAGSRGLTVYSPTLNIALVFAESKVSSSTYLKMTSYTGFVATAINIPSGSKQVVRGAMWHPTLNKFIILLSGTNSSGTSSSTFTTYASTDGSTWTALGDIANVGLNTNIKYHSGSGHIVFFDNSNFYYSTDAGATWSSVGGFSGSMTTGQYSFISNISTLTIGSYVMANNMNDPPGNLFAYWSGSAWSKYTTSQNFSSFGNPKDYHIAEDRIYMRYSNSSAGTSFTIFAVDSASTKTPDQWATTLISNISVSSTIAMPLQFMAYAPMYGMIGLGGSTVNGFPALNLIVMNNKTTTKEISLGGVAGASWGANIYNIPFLWTSDNTVVFPGTSTSETYATVYSTPSGLSNGILFGSTTITENEIGVLDAVNAGAASASKALVVDANRNISNINSLSATTLTGTIQTAAQPSITSVGALTGLTIASGNNLTIGSTAISEAEIGVVDAVTPGTVAASKAVVVDANKDISSFRNLTSVNLTSTAGSLTMGSTAISEAEIGVLDAVTPGTAAASKAVVLGSTKSVSGLFNVGAVGLTLSQQTPSLLQTFNTFSADVSTLDSTNATASYFRQVAKSSSNACVAIFCNLSAASTKYFQSADGLTWTAYNLPQSMYVCGVVWASHLSKFVMFGCTTVSSSTIYGYTSSDGITWSLVSQYNSLSTSPKRSHLAYSSYGQRIFMICNTTILSTTDCSTWTTSTLNTPPSQPDFHNLFQCAFCFASYFIATYLGDGSVFHYYTLTPTSVPSTESGTYTDVDVGNVVNIGYSPSLDRLVYYRYNVYGDYKLHFGYINNFSTQGPTSTSVFKNQSFSLGSTIQFYIWGLNWDDTYNFTLGLRDSASGASGYYMRSVDGINWTTPVDVTSYINVNRNVAFLGLPNSTLAMFSSGAKTTIGTYTVGVVGAYPTITMGSTAISESEIGVLDAVTPGTASVSKALVLNSSGSVSGINSLSSTSLTSTAGSLTMGTTSISESEIGVLDAVSPGVVAASKAVVVDQNKDISSFRNLTAVNLTGTLQTAAQPTVTSVGTLDSLAVTGDISTASNLVIGSTSINESEFKVLDAVTPGTVKESSAVVVDENKDISTFRNLTATNLIATDVTGTLQTAAQPNVRTVSTLDVTAHDGETQGLKLGGVLLTATASQLNSFVDGTSASTFYDATITHDLTLSNHDGESGLILGSTLVTSSANQLNYTNTTQGMAQASKALVFDSEVSIDGIHSLTASQLTGTLQTAAQPNVTSVSVLDVTAHDGTTQGLKLGGVLLTATATQINSIFGAGGTGTFQDLAVNHNLTLANANGVDQGLVLGSTLVTASGTELNYLDGSTPGSATASNALVLDSNKNISGINSLSATELTGTIQTAAQPNVTSVGTLTSLSVAGDVTVGSTTISENEIKVLDAVTPGTVKASSAVVVDENKDISTFRNLTATNLIATNVTGTLQTEAQPNITSVGELTSLDVAGDVNVGGSLNVGGTFISQSEILALDNAIPGTAEPNKAMITDVNNSIANISSLTAVQLTGTLQTAAQPKITSVGQLTNLDVAGDVKVGGSLVVGGTFISEAEIHVLDQSMPGHAEHLKAMITDADNSIANINSLSATSLTGEIQTAAQPKITSVTTLDITAHDGTSVGLELGGTLVTASASELNYVDTTAGSAQPSKALVLDSSSDISGIHNVSLVGLTAETGSFTKTTDSSSVSTGAIVTAGGVGIAKKLNVGSDAAIAGNLAVAGTTTHTGDVAITSVDDSTSESTGALTTAGGVGIAKSLFVGANAKVIGDVEITGSRTQAGVDVITNDTDSTSPSTGSLITAGGVGIAKKLNVGSDAAVGGAFSVAGATALTGSASVLSTTDSSSASSGSIVTAGGVGIAKALNVGTNASVAGNLAVTGTSALTGLVSISNITDSSSAATGSFTTIGGVGVAKNLHVGGVASMDNSTNSTSASTGALVVAGGVGIGGDANIGGTVGIGGNANVAGSVVVDGGVTSSNVVFTPAEPSSSLYEISVASDYVLNETGAGYHWNIFSTPEDAGTHLMTLNADGLSVGTNTHLGNGTDSGSVSTGALTVGGGVGISKSVNVGDNVSIGDNLSVGGTSSLTGLVSITNVTNSSSSSTGSIVTAGGVGVAKNLTVGVDASIGANFAVSGASEFTGIVSAISVADSTSTSTGAIVTAGGVGIAKALNVGTDASVSGNVSIGGTTTQTGVVSIVNASDSTSISTGSLVTAGGVGVAKNLTVGVNASVGGNVSIAGTTTQTGVVTVSNATDSTATTDGSIVTAGGVGIAQSLNVGGVAKIVNTTASTAFNSGALVVAGGVGVGGDINVDGTIGVAGDIDLSGDINIGGKLNSSNLTLIPDANAQFSTLPLTSITKLETILAINENVGIGHVESADAIVVVPEVVTKHSLVYYGTNSEAFWATLGLSGNALSAYDTTYAGYTIAISQLVVNSATGTIWLAASLSKDGSSIPVVLSGTIDTGISTLRTIGSLAAGAHNCSGVAVATDSKVAVIVSGSALYYLNTAVSAEFQQVTTDSFESISWCNGLDKFIATRSGSSSIYASNNSNATTWESATTPSSSVPYSVCFNTTLNLAIAVGSNFIWYSNNGLTWTNGTYSALTGGDVFNAVVNSPVSGLFAVYSNINNSAKQLYYSVDGMNWTTITITETFGYATSTPSTVAYDATNNAYTISVFEGSTIIQKIGPIDTSTMTYGVGIVSGYMTSASGTGYQWFNHSTASNVGHELMQLDSSRLSLNTIEQITNTTDSHSSSTGSLVTSGGVGIAKSLNVGSNIVVGGNLSISGTTTQSGSSVFSNTTDSTTTSNGAIVTAGGVGIAKALNVGTNARVSGGLTIVGTSTLTGVVSVIGTSDSSSSANGSLITAGGVGIAKSLNVGNNASVAGDLEITGASSLTGVVSINNETDSSSASTGALAVVGGVGIGASLTVGQNAQVNGDVSITGTTTQTGVVSIVNATDSTSASTGSLTVAGGAGIAKSLNVGQNAAVSGSLAITGVSTLMDDVSITSATSSTSSSTGSLVTAGGVGITKSLNVGMDANVGGVLTVNGLSTITNTTNAASTTSGSFTTAGGVGIAKALFVGEGIYGTIQTAAQPNISSVTQLNITSHDGTQGLSLGGNLVASNALELNYLHGSTPGTATAGNALVVSLASSIDGINSLTATKLTGELQTASQPKLTSVTTLNITGHDGASTGLELGGVLLEATAAQLNTLVAGTSSSTFSNATVSNNLTLSGADGSTKGLILGSTLVTSSADQLNYVNTTEGAAQASKALVLDWSSSISGINSLTANSLTGTLVTAYQPNVTSVNTLNITGANGTTAGLQLGGALVTSSATQLNYVNTTPGSAQASKALVLDMSSNISGINSLAATSLTGTLQTAAQPNVTSVGTLTSLAIANSGLLTMGSTAVAESDILKIVGITDGSASPDKALVLDSSSSISGINSLSASTISIGAPIHNDLPLEVGVKTYMYSGAYAYNNNLNAHGIVDAGMGVSANYSLRTDGRIMCTGEIELTSDRRMKKNIVELTSELSKKFVMTTTPVKFNWVTGDDKIEYGYIAQEIARKGFTDLVNVTECPGMEGSVEEDGFVNPQDAKFVFSPGKIIPLLALNQRDVFEQLEEKDAKIADLESRLAALEAIFNKMA